MSKVLIVEDELSIAELEKDYLELSSFEVEIETDGQQGLEKALKNDFDMIILDIMLPGVDGFEICKQIREAKEIPILMVSARKEDIDKIRGLGLGADDYITKPFLTQELLLRVSLILKRTYRTVLNPVQTAGIKIGNAMVDFRSATIKKDGVESALTAKELAILKKLADNRGNIVTFDMLCEAVWGDGYYGYENTLMVHMRHLREKIEDNPSKPEYILTVRGLGYRLAKEVAE